MPGAIGGQSCHKVALNAGEGTLVFDGSLGQSPSASVSFVGTLPDSVRPAGIDCRWQG